MCSGRREYFAPPELDDVSESSSINILVPPGPTRVAPATQLHQHNILTLTCSRLWPHDSFAFRISNLTHAKSRRSLGVALRVHEGG